MQIGDKMLVVKKVPYGPRWNDEGKMEKTIGQVGTIERIDDVGARLDFEDGSRWSYHEDSLEPVPALELGDEVRVVGRMPPCFKGPGPGWNSKMDETLGKVGMIIGIGGRIRVKFDDVVWNYTGDVLKLVPPPPVVVPVHPDVGKAITFFQCFSIKVGVVEKVLTTEGKYHVMGTDGVLYVIGMSKAELLDVKFDYYRVPKEMYSLPDKPNQQETEKQLVRYVKSARWNYAPHNKGGAVVARATIFGKKMEGVAICSLKDNFDWAEGRKLAVLDLASVV